jgi:hypothetical protein
VQVRIPWRKKPVLVYPILPAPPTAILIEGFRETATTRVFENGWCAAARHFAPASIAATPSQLDALLGTEIPSLRNAIIALIRPGEPRLSEEDRERYWRAFRVPVFEQRIDASAKLLAAECEAHDGLHIEQSGIDPQEGEIVETTICGCGRNTPRIVAPERFANVRKVAAYAR